MKFNLFALACIAAASEARSRRNDSSSASNEAKQEFLNWASQNGLSYSGMDEFARRERTWLETDRKIKETNRAAELSGDASALKLKHTVFSAMDEEERKKHMGLKLKEGALQGRKKELEAKRDQEGGRRKLSLKSNHKDWAAEGVTGPVKDQGGCGSCYTFSSNTTLEARIAIETGTYQRLSEQQIVDCANWDATQYFWLYGCDGGYMSEVWWYQRDYGAMADADYPYVSGTTGEVGACMENADQYVASVVEWGEVDGSSTANIASALEEGPLAIAVAAYSDTWFNYGGGIVTSDNSDCNPDWLDHAVVLVGYSEGGSDSDELVVTETVETTCRR